MRQPQSAHIRHSASSMFVAHFSFRLLRHRVGLLQMAVSVSSSSRLSLQTKRGEAIVAEAQASLLTCQDCLRTSQGDNPCPRRHAGKTLKFANSTQCLPCRNFMNTGLKHKTRSQIRAEIRKYPAKRIEYNKARSEHERLLEESPGKQVRNLSDKIYVPTWLQATEEIAQAKRKFVGAVWPPSALDREGIAYDMKDLEEFEGEDEKGVVRDSKHTPVSGCVQITQLHAKRAKRVREVGHSDSAMPGELGDKWAALATPTLKATVAKDGDNETVKISVEGAPARDDDDDSWDDLLPTFSFNPEVMDDPGDEGNQLAQTPRRKPKQEVGQPNLRIVSSLHSNNVGANIWLLVFHCVLVAFEMSSDDCTDCASERKTREHTRTLWKSGSCPTQNPCQVKTKNPKAGNNKKNNSSEGVAAEAASPTELRALAISAIIRVCLEASLPIGSAPHDRAT